MLLLLLLLKKFIIFIRVNIFTFSVYTTCFTIFVVIITISINLLYTTIAKFTVLMFVNEGDRRAGHLDWKRLDGGNGAAWGSDGGLRKQMAICDTILTITININIIIIISTVIVNVIIIVIIICFTFMISSNVNVVVIISLLDVDVVAIVFSQLEVLVVISQTLTIELTVRGK